MSYNITNCKVNEMEDFTLKYELLKPGQLTKHIGEAVILDPILRKIRMSLCEGAVEGILVIGSDILAVTSFSVYGEGSGHLMEDVLKPAFGQSTGVLKMRLVWEGGDTVENMTVTNGIIQRENT